MWMVDARYVTQGLLVNLIFQGRESDDVQEAYGECPAFARKFHLVVGVLAGLWCRSESKSTDR